MQERLDIAEAPLKRPAAQPRPLSADRLARACADFEALFLQQLFKQMRATVPRAELLGGGSAETLYTEMLDGEMSRNLAGGRGIGLAEVLYRQLKERPED